ncbi:hypothetical protein [Psychrosphaera aestuarii]|nr:hypothetical protein [Psychrosphaera aestuarii]
MPTVIFIKPGVCIIDKLSHDTQENINVAETMKKQQEGRPNLPHH